MSNRHPDHDAVAAFIRSGYTQSYPAMGYHVQRRRFGYYQRHDAGFGTVQLESIRPGEVPDLLDDVLAYYGDTPTGIYTEGETMDAALGPALAAAGCQPGAVQVHLAHVGGPPPVVPVPGVTVEQIDDGGIEEWTRVKLMGFDNSESEPDAESVRVDNAIRRAEMTDEGRFFLARTAEGDAASILGCYEAETDTIIFLLATRVPFRRRGIARWLLARTIADAKEKRHRSVTISCDPDDTPIQLYRRIGFTDEVYRRRRYELPHAS